MNEINAMDKDTEQETEMFQSELENINVNVWVNKLENRLQYCLVKDNANEGFLQYKMLVLHAELLAISSNKINEEEYTKEVEDLVSQLEDTDEKVKGMKEAMIKYKIILRQFLKENKSNLNLTF
jgi:hypothetical protein